MTAISFEVDIANATFTDHTSRVCLILLAFLRCTLGGSSNLGRGLAHLLMVIGVWARYLPRSLVTLFLIGTLQCCIIISSWVSSISWWTTWSTKRSPGGGCRRSPDPGWLLPAGGSPPPPPPPPPPPGYDGLGVEAGEDRNSKRKSRGVKACYRSSVSNRSHRMDCPWGC